MGLVYSLPFSTALFAIDTGLLAPRRFQPHFSGIQMQLQMFYRKIVDYIGTLGGATAPRVVRADDGLIYVVKDDAPGILLSPPHVRASECICLSLANIIGLPSPVPVVIEDRTGRLVQRCPQCRSVPNSGSTTRSSPGCRVKSLLQT